jgi:hypothetical protein
MSYSAVRPINGLGYTMTIGTPVGDQKITIPIEQLAKDSAQIALNAIWPIAMNALKGELPNLMNMAVTELKPYLEEEKKKIVAEANKLMSSAETKVQTQVKKTTNIAGMFIGLLIVGGAGVVLFSKVKKKQGAV